MEAAPPSKTFSEVATQAVEKAVNALLKWKLTKAETQKPQLLSSDEFLYLVLTLTKIPARDRINAHKISLPHPLYTADSSQVCLFVHDSNSQLAKEKIEEGEIPVSQVIKLSKLKRDYMAFEQKRKLCDSFDLFLADKKIIPLLPKAIGKQFSKKKKIPVPIELGRSNWKEQIERVCRSAMLYLNTGTCSVIKVAKGSMEKDEILENVVAAVNGVAEIVPKKWANVRSFHLKFSESLALPIYQKVPEMSMEIGGMMVGSDGNGDGKVVVLESKKKREKEKVGKKKGRIHEVRYMDSVGFDGMVGEDESGSEEDDDEVMEGEVGSGENFGKKRKKGDVEKGLKKGVKDLKQKKDKVLAKSMTEKKFKKSRISV